MLFLLVSRIIIATIDTPTYQSVRQNNQSSYIQIFDRQQQSLSSIRTDFDTRKSEWVEEKDFSEHLKQAVLRSEDKRFYQHHGVDWIALANAFRGYLLQVDKRGASTITMQLVGLLDPSLQGSGQRRLWQKIKQLYYAQSLEMHWTKAQILEAYLNLVPLRGEVVGMPSGAKTFFQKYTYALNKREASVLAAMLRAPNVSVSLLAKRACLLIESKTCDYMPDFIANAVNSPQSYYLDNPEETPHYARALLSEYQKNKLTIPPVIRSTIDKKLQQYVKQRVHARLVELFQEKVSDAAVVVLDNNSGEILAYLGSSANLSNASQVDHVQALRQAGSTLKPFLYAQAFDNRLLTAASLLNDSEMSVAVDTGLYIPQNYDKGFKGWVSVRTALASSLNIPAVQTLTMIGAEDFRDELVALGLPLYESGDYYGYSLALGSADITLLSLTNAYRALANKGIYSPVQWINSEYSNPHQSENRTKDTGKEIRVFSEQSAWIIQHILSDRTARTITFGLDSALSTPYHTAVKTGTSKDMRDNWTIGWSPKYTVGVWVGNSAGESMRNISGVSGAAPIWHDVMDYLHKNNNVFFDPMPQGIVAKQVHYEPTVEADRQEFFIHGTEMDVVRLSQQSPHKDESDITTDVTVNTMISQPTDGTIIAIDPDIPVSQQALKLAANNVNQQRADHIIWYLNGKEISRENPYYLPITTGKFTLELFSIDGRKLDEVHFSVRGIR